MGTQCLNEIIIVIIVGARSLNIVAQYTTCSIIHRRQPVKGKAPKTTLFYNYSLFFMWANGDEWEVFT